MVVLGLAMSTFLYHGLCKSVPASLEEAAIIDGASVFQVYFKIVMPLVNRQLYSHYFPELRGSGMIISCHSWALGFRNKTLTLALYYAKMKTVLIQCLGI